MSNVFGAYLEDYQYIKLIIPQATKFNLNQIVLNGDGQKYHLHIIKQETFGEEIHLHMTYLGVVKLHIDYFVKINGDLTYSLSLGKITRSPRFDFENYYDGPLGFTYQADKTTFRLWTPVAKEVILVLNQKNEEKKYHSKYLDRGLWEITIDGDLDGVGYYYLVRINQELTPVLDPYAISSNANSKMNYVVDLSKAYQMTSIRPDFSGNYVDAIIYEMHLRDFSIGRFKKDDNTKRRSFYLEALQNDDKLFLSNGLDYLLELGVTHIQILPINAFGGVDETDQQGLYNWGYNPVEFNVPSGWHSINPDDPYSRINEVRQMIDGLHQVGLLVNLDVVYNHVYDVYNYSWSTLVPGYGFRIDKQNFLTSFSGCGNDIATEKKMMRRYIVDSVLYWIKTYQVDGFRFDLMGLMDASLMNEIDQKARSLYPQIILYGEGWKMETGLLPHEEANMFNYWQLPSYAFFNDFYRNLIKGDPFKMTKGFAMGEKTNRHDLEMAIKGSAADEFRFLEPSQSLNYIECHDNKTFFDQLIKNTPKLSVEEQKNMVRLGLGLVIISQGIPFIHAGQEFMRTKFDYENSYNLPDFVNQIDWERRTDYDDVVQSLKDLISVRKDYSVFRLSKSELSKRVVFDKGKANTLSFRLLGLDSELQVLCKNDNEIEIYYFAPGVKLIYDGNKRINQEIDTITIEQPGVYIFKRK